MKSGDHHLNLLIYIMALDLIYARNLEDLYWRIRRTNTGKLNGRIFFHNSVLDPGLYSQSIPIKIIRKGIGDCE